MGYFDHIETKEQLEKPVSQGGMSMGEGGTKVQGWPGDCPNSPDPEKRHIVTVLSCVQSVEHFKCNYCNWETYD